MPEASGGRLENWGMESSEGSFPQASARCWGLAEAVAGAFSEILPVASTCGVSLITKWWLGWSCYRHGSVQLLRPPWSTTVIKSQGKVGMGEEIHCCFKAWALPKPPLLPVGGCDESSGVLRDTALGLSLGPSAHLQARSGSGRPWGEGRDPPPATLSVPRTTVKLTEQELCHANGHTEGSRANSRDIVSRQESHANGLTLTASRQLCPFYNVKVTEELKWELFCDLRQNSVWNQLRNKWKLLKWRQWVRTVLGTFRCEGEERKLTN